jgi:hypothetical protein
MTTLLNHQKKAENLKRQIIGSSTLNARNKEQLLSNQPLMKFLIRQGKNLHKAITKKL